MPLSLQVGDVLDERVYEVAREKVREYALATGAGPVPDRGEVVAPPTFAACFTLARPDGGFLTRLLEAYAGVLHTQQSFTFHRPVVVGDTLTCRTTVDRLVTRDQMDLLTLTTRCTAADAPVVDATTTLALVKA